MNDLPIDRKDTLRSIRIKFGLTQAQVADAIGVSENTIRKLEADSSNISLKHMLKLEKLYGVNARVFFFGKESAFSELLKRNAHDEQAACKEVC